MMKNRLLAGAVFGALFAAAVTPALAEDAPGGTLVPGAQLAQVPPPPPVLDWTGFYVGVNGGWVGSARDRVVNTGTDTGALGLGTFLTTPGPFGGRAIPNQLNLPYDGWQAGATLGYNKQVAPQWVLGFEMDFDDGDATGSRSFFFPGTPGTPIVGTNFVLPGLPGFATSFKRSVGFISTDRVRAGFLPAPNLMLFVSGGLAWGETTMSASWNCPTCVPPSATQSTTTDNHHRWGAGLAWGGGAEWMFLPNWSLKAEYIRADLGTAAANLRYVYPVPPTNVSTLRSASTFVVDIVRVGLNYHF